MRALSWWRRRTPAVVPVSVDPIVDLAHPDRATRQAAEAAWLATHRAHQAAVVAQREAGADA